MNIRSKQWLITIALIIHLLTSSSRKKYVIHWELVLLDWINLEKLKDYDERRDKDITHVIYSLMIIQNHIESSISMMIIKLDQHSIILDKLWMKKHDVNYHDHDDSISFYLDHCNHLEAFNHSYSNRSIQTRTMKKFFSRKETSLINQKSSRTKKYSPFSKRLIIQKWS
jgi:general stress protein CsbA